MRFGWGIELGLLCASIAVAPLAFAEGASPTHDGPFGIYMGEPISALGPVQPDGAGTYDVLKPARPNVSFPRVAVEAYPTIGVCTILAWRSITDDPAGAKVLRATDDLGQALKAKYGDFEKIDECDVADEACSSAWATEAVQGAARYGYKWEFARPHQDGTRMIVLAAGAIDAATTKVMIGYYSSDEERCEAAKKAALAGGL